MDDNFDFEACLNTIRYDMLCTPHILHSYSSLPAGLPTLRRAAGRVRDDVRDLLRPLQ